MEREEKSIEKDSDFQVNAARCRELIIGLAMKIDNPKILTSIYSFIIGILSIKEKQETD